MAGRSDVDLSQEGDLGGSEEEVVAPRRVAHLSPIPAVTTAPAPATPATAARASVVTWAVAAAVVVGLGAAAVLVIVMLGGVGFWAASQATGG